MKDIITDLCHMGREDLIILSAFVLFFIGCIAAIVLAWRQSWLKAKDERRKKLLGIQPTLFKP